MIYLGIMRLARRLKGMAEARNRVELEKKLKGEQGMKLKDFGLPIPHWNRKFLIYLRMKNIRDAYAQFWVKFWLIRMIDEKEKRLKAYDP